MAAGGRARIGEPLVPRPRGHAGHRVLRPARAAWRDLLRDRARARLLDAARRVRRVLHGGELPGRQWRDRQALVSDERLWAAGARVDAGVGDRRCAAAAEREVTPPTSSDAGLNIARGLTWSVHAPVPVVGAAARVH